MQSAKVRHSRNILIKALKNPSSLESGKLHLTYRIKDSSAYNYVFLINKLKDPITITNWTGDIKVFTEALNNKGEWKSIEYWPTFWCGTGIGGIDLQPDHYIWTKRPRYKGNYSTKLRYSFQFGEEKIVSNQFEGSINYSQFKPFTDSRFPEIVSRDISTHSDDEEFLRTILDDSTHTNDNRALSAYLLTNLMLKEQKFELAHSYCEETILLNSKLGARCLIKMGDIYLNSYSACSEMDEWQAKTMIWLAIDTWENASEVDPDLKPKTEQRVESVLPYLPTKEEAIEANYEVDLSPKDKTQYFVRCWLNKYATVRFKQ